MSIFLRSTAWVMICLGLVGASCGTYLYCGGHFKGLAGAEVRVVRAAAAGVPKEKGEPRKNRAQISAEIDEQTQAQERRWLLRFLGWSGLAGLCGAATLLFVSRWGRSSRAPSPSQQEQPVAENRPRAQVDGIAGPMAKESVIEPQP